MQCRSFECSEVQLSFCYLMLPDNLYDIGHEKNSARTCPISCYIILINYNFARRGGFSATHLKFLFLMDVEPFGGAL